MDLTKKKCIPCEGYTDPLFEKEEEKYLKEISNWNINREDRIELRKFSHYFTLRLNKFCQPNCRIGRRRRTPS
jgi:hypothetical protein